MKPLVRILHIENVLLYDSEISQMQVKRTPIRQGFQDEVNWRTLHNSRKWVVEAPIAQHHMQIIRIFSISSVENCFCHWSFGMVFCASVSRRQFSSSAYHSSTIYCFSIRLWIWKKNECCNSKILKCCSYTNRTVRALLF